MSRPVLTVDEANRVAKELEAIELKLQRRLWKSIQELDEASARGESDIQFLLIRAQLRGNCPHFVRVALDDMIRCYFATSTFKSLPTVEVVSLREPVLKACQARMKMSGSLLSIITQPVSNLDHEFSGDSRYENESEKLLKEVLDSARAWERHLEDHKLQELIQLKAGSEGALSISENTPAVELMKKPAIKDIHELTRLSSTTIFNHRRDPKSVSPKTRDKLDRAIGTLLKTTGQK